jgi:DNA-binding CsgD family transcriptional regulator
VTALLHAPSATTSASLLALYRELRARRSVEDLFARAADLAPAACGFSRGVVASVSEGRLTVTDSLPLADPVSDELRRRLLSAPIDLEPGTEESEYVRAGRRPGSRRRRSAVAERLELRVAGFGAIVPEATTLALLIVDRPGPPATDAELSRLNAYAAMIGIALEQLVLRQRVTELALEVRQFAGVAQALAREVLDAPPALDAEHLFSVPPTPGAIIGLGGEDDLLARLSDSERPVARLLAEGRSNREIAALLVVSPETIKSHVGQILRKLGVANRVEAAALLLRAAR